ncbi:MAG: hypothetical protein FJ100_06535 [Deltaproteobacteria bacterium]|nr:hypothetical protein [Deltaproteobacteria bacterium]
MDWYFDLADASNAETWRQMRARKVRARPCGLALGATTARHAATQMLTLAALQWVARERPDRLDAFVTAVLDAVAAGRDVYDPQALCDLGGAAGLDRLGADAAAETEVFAHLAQWRALGGPELPCLVRADGHVLLGRNPPEHVAQFAA